MEPISDDDAPGDPAGGKADEPFAPECPSAVTLNSAKGSMKRCIDDDTGRFVASVCCADVCSGAGLREQSNGTRCAWLDEPGLDGARKGQFAPQLCSDLNESLACGRGESVEAWAAAPARGGPAILTAFLAR